MHVVLPALLFFLCCLQARSIVHVSVKVKAEDPSSLSYNAYVACLSDFPDKPKSCERKPDDVRQGPEYTNTSIFHLSKAELTGAKEQGAEISQWTYVRIPWRSVREPQGQQYLLITDNEYRVREVVDISLVTLDSPTLTSSVLGLTITVSIRCKLNMYGPVCIVGCNQNPRWTCHPETGELSCNGNLHGFHCDKEYCLHGGSYENRTRCKCTEGWKGQRCNETSTGDGSDSESNSHLLLIIVVLIVSIVAFLGLMSISALAIVKCRRKPAAGPSSQSSRQLLVADKDRAEMLQE